MLHLCTQSLRPTRRKEDVPLLFREPHVETGFRDLHQPWRYYLLSLFQVHNECMNVWTHLLAFVLTAIRLYGLWHQHDFLNDPHLWPLLAGMLSMLIMYVCSCLAHCLQSRSEIVHYTCFMCDYAGIGLYGLGSVLLHSAYCCDERMYSTLKHAWLPVGTVLSVAVSVCCSISKTRYRRPYPFSRKLWQLIPVTAVYIWLILPIAHRTVLYLLFGEWSASMKHHLQQVGWILSAGFFFGSDIPQRFFPGKCDFLFHSHQIFHLCIMMTSCKQLDGIYLDIKDRHDFIYGQETPTVLNTFGYIVFAIMINTLVVLGFHHYVKHKILREAKDNYVQYEINSNGKQHQF